MKSHTIPFLFAAVLILTSCRTSREIRAYERRYGPKAPVPTVTALRSATPIRLDGVLDEDVWKKAPVYNMTEPVDIPAGPVARSKFSMKWKDFFPGTVRFACTDDTLYIAVTAKDGDIVQFDRNNQRPHWRSGDLIEVFLKSDKAPGFWECYATPCGHRTTMRYIARGYCSDAMEAGLRDDFASAVKLDGTLNDRSDVDRGYTMEIAIPFKMAEALDGIPMTPDGGWKIFVGRYNYDWRYSFRQLSSFPVMAAPKFETYEYYSPIIFK